MADAPEVPRRPMKYPYTLGAKIAQFPFKFYINNNWVARYYILGFICSIPVFRAISNAVNSPGNVALWAEKRRLEAEAAHH